MNLKSLEDRLYPAHLSVPIEFSEFYGANMCVELTQSAIESYRQEYAEELYKAVKRYVTHGQTSMFLQEENQKILLNKIRSDFELSMQSQKPTDGMLRETLLFMIEGK